MNDLIKISGKDLELIYLGTYYGGWAICPHMIKKDSIIYSFGIGQDISFDLEMIRKFDVEIFGFDPTPKCIDWISQQYLPKNFNFYPFGISKNNGYSFFNLPKNPNFISLSETEEQKGYDLKLPVKNLSTIMKEFGHDHIDILKLDVEGSEYSVFEEMMKKNIWPDQILVEFHDTSLNRERKMLKMMSEYYSIYAKRSKVQKRSFKDFYFIKK